MKTDIEQVWIRTLKTKTGTRTTIGLAHVYEDSHKALEVEPKHVIERNKIPEKKEEVDEDA